MDTNSQMLYHIKHTDELLAQYCSQQISHSEKISSDISEIKALLTTLVELQNRENYLMKGLAKINDAVCTTNIELREKMGEYMKTESPKDSITVAKLGDKGFIITGDTYDHKDAIKAKFPVSWNQDPKGWVIKEELKDELIEFLKEKNINVTIV